MGFSIIFAKFNGRVRAYKVQTGSVLHEGSEPYNPTTEELKEDLKKLSKSDIHELYWHNSQSYGLNDKVKKDLYVQRVSGMWRDILRGARHSFPQTETTGAQNEFKFKYRAVSPHAENFGIGVAKKNDSTKDVLLSLNIFDYNRVLIYTVDGEFSHSELPNFYDAVRGEDRNYNDSDLQSSVLVTFDITDEQQEVATNEDEHTDKDIPTDNDAKEADNEDDTEEEDNEDEHTDKDIPTDNDAKEADNEDDTEEEDNEGDNEQAEEEEPTDDEEVEVEEEEEEVQTMLMWNEGDTKVLKTLTRLNSGPIFVNSDQYEEMKDKKQQWEHFLSEAGKSLVCVKPFNGDDYQGDAYLLNDIGRFTANDFMLLLQNKFQKFDDHTAYFLKYGNKKVEHFRRIVEYVKGKDKKTAEDCTFYLCPKLSGGAKRPANNDPVEVKMARMVARLKTDAREVEPTEVDAFAIALRELAEYVKDDLNVQELICNATKETLEECKGLVDRNKGGRMAQSRVESIACHLIPNLYDLSENFVFAKDLYNHLIEKFIVSYAKEYNEEHGGQYRISNSAFYDAVDGAIKLKVDAEQKGALQKQNAEKDAQIQIVMNEAHAIAERMAREKLHSLAQSNPALMQVLGVADVDMESS